MPLILDKYYYDNIYVPDSFDDEGHIVINDRGISNFSLAKPLIKDFNKSRSYNFCPYCKTNILQIKRPFYFGNRREKQNMYAKLSVWNCINCSFWKVHQFSWNHDSPVSSQWENLFTSKLKEFDTALPEFFKEEISIQLKRQPDLLYSYNPLHFERYVACLLYTSQSIPLS